MKRGSKLSKNEEKKESSADQNTKELNDVVVHRSPFFPSIFNSLWQFTTTILRFLGFHVRRPNSSSSEKSYPVDSYPPPAPADPPVEEPGQGEEAFAKRVPPPPPPSNGGGGQIT